MKRFLTLVFVFCTIALFSNSHLRAKWQETNGAIYGGAILSLAVSGDNFYVGTTTGGVFLSTDNGDNWLPKNSAFEYSKVISLAAKDNYVFAGTNGAGIFVSSNNGDSWQLANNGLTNKVVYTLAINGECIYAGTNSGGIYVSTDNGSTWKNINPGLISENIQVFLFTENLIYAGTKNGLYMTSDGGASWNARGFKNTSVLSLAIIGKTLFGGSDNGLVRSKNGGETWSKPQEGLTTQKVRSLQVKSDSLFASTDKGIYLSVDDGFTWESKNNGLSTLNMQKILFYENYLLATSGDGGIFKSLDLAENWINIRSDLYKSKVSGIRKINNTLYVGTSDNGLFVSTDNGVCWLNRTPSKSDSNIRTMAIKDDKIFVGTKQGLFGSNEKGLNWNLINFGSNALSINSVLVNNDDLWATTAFGVYFSINLGQNWYLNKAGNYIKIAVKNNTVLVSASFYDNSEYVNGIYLSTDYGTNWESKVISLSNQSVIGISFDSEGIVAATRDEVYYSTTGKSEWYKIKSPMAIIQALATYGESIFIATQDGLQCLENHGSTWFKNNIGLVNLTVNSIMVADGYVYVGTNGNGIFKAPLSDFGITSIEDSPLQNNLDFTISPNPAIENIRISLQSDYQNANIKITNAQGIEFIDNTYAYLMKDNSIEINTKELPIGIYFCTINSGNLVATQKFVVIR